MQAFSWLSRMHYDVNMNILTAFCSWEKPKKTVFYLESVKLFSGRRFLGCQYSFTRCNNATFVIARPQNVAVAISGLRAIEIASLRSQWHRAQPYAQKDVMRCQKIISHPISTTSNWPTIYQIQIYKTVWPLLGCHVTVMSHVTMLIITAWPL